MKRIICIFVIACCMVAATFTVFADKADTTAENENISLMNDLGIFDNVKQENSQGSITRAVYAKITDKLLGGTGNEKASKRIYTDIDVDNELAGTIEFLYNRGVMLGYGDAAFKPDENVTYAEAVKIAVAITGHDDEAKTAGGYVDGYYTIAANNSLIKGVSGKKDDPITYSDAALLVKNILENTSYAVTKKYVNGYPVNEKNDNDEEFMSYMLDIYTYTGTVSGYKSMSLKSSEEEFNNDITRIDAQEFHAGNINMDAYFGMKVKAYYKNDKNDTDTILHVTKDRDDTLIDVDAGDVNKDSTKSEFSYYIGQTVKKVNLSASAIFILNGKKLDIAADADLIPDEGSVRLIDNDGDLKYDVIIIEDYKNYVVDKAVATDLELTFKFGETSLSLDPEDGVDAVYYADGAEADFTSISSGSIISVEMSRNLTGRKSAKIYISNNKIASSAKNVSNGDDDKSITLDDGTEYTVSKSYARRLKKNQAETYLPNVGESGTFYIDYFNKVEAFLILNTGKNYAYVTKCYYNDGEDKGYIRVFTKEGKFVTYELTDKIKVNGNKLLKSKLPDFLKTTSDDGTVNQLVIVKSNTDNMLTEIKTAENKTSDKYYLATADEFVLNAHPKNSAGIACGVRFYKNMAEDRPYCFVDNKSVQFMIPTDKTDEASYKISTKLSSTDVSLPAPLYIYDCGASGEIGAVTSNTASEGKYSTPVIVDSVGQGITEDDEECLMIKFFDGTSVFAGDNVIYDQPATSDSKGSNNWRSRVDYTDVRISDLKRGDVIEYTTSNNKVEMLRVIVKVDNIGPVRIDGDNIQLNGNMIADVVSVSDGGRTALVYYVNRFGTEVYQTMLINGTVYKYDSSDKKVYNSSVSDIRAGDRVLINSYWWSPKVVVIFR